MRPLPGSHARAGAPRLRALRSRGRARLSCAAALALAAGLVVVTPALSAPLDPVFPAANDVVSPATTFSWLGPAPGSTTQLDVYVVAGGAPVKVAQAAPTATQASSAPLPDDTRLQWFVRAVNAAGSTLLETSTRTPFVVASTPGPPAITVAPPAIGRSPSPPFAWTGTRVSSAWSILNPAGVTVQSGVVPTGGGQVVPVALPDGSYQFRVAQRNLLESAGPPASYGFSIDTAAPGPLTLRRSTSQRDSRNTPRYSWSGLEPGATVTWQVLRASGRLVQGPGNVAAGDVTPSRLASGSYVFEARQTDLAGNSGPPATDAFVVLPRLAPGIRLPMRNVRRLTPKVGATVLAVRPTLRWRSGPKGTRTYNVQVFKVVGGAKLRKVVSAFPHRRRFVVPRRKALDRGACYVWRVWPFRGARPLKEPVGVSHFCVRPT